MENLELRKKNFSNKKQLEKLVNLMEQNPYIAKGITKKKEAEQKWKDFAKELNLLGPPNKSFDKWNRVWIDLKFKVKKKIIQNKKEIGSTGGLENNLIHLSTMDEKIADFLNLNVCVDPPGRELGAEVDTFSFPQQIAEVNEEIIAQEDTVQEQVSNAPNQNIRTRIPNSLRKRLDILEKHAEDFKKVKQYQRTTAEYTKKSYYLQKETNRELLKIKKEKLEVYKQEIEIRRQMLEIQNFQNNLS